MKAIHIPRHSIVKFKGSLYMLENHTRYPILIPGDQKIGIELMKNTELEVIKFPAQLAIEYLNNLQKSEEKP